MALGSKTPETGTVCIADKSAPGHELRVFKEITKPEPIHGGGYRDVKRWIPSGKAITTAGTAHKFGAAPRVPIVGGYAMNENMDAATWNAWLEQNAESPAVVNQQIAGFANRADADAWARERAGIASGDEPIMPEEYDINGNITARDPRVPVGIRRDRAA